MTMPSDDEIARALQAALEAGELHAAPSWGRPLAPLEGWEDTPPALRMPFKILKDAGYAPPDLLLFRERAALRERRDAAPDGPARDALNAALVALEQKIALRLESLRRHGQL